MNTILLTTCDTCAYFRAVGADPVNVCTFNPPSAVLVAVPGPDGRPIEGQMQKLTFYPAPEPNWTCAKHQSRRH